MILEQIQKENLAAAILKFMMSEGSVGTMWNFTLIQSNEPSDKGSVGTMWNITLVRLRLSYRYCLHVIPC